MTKLGVNIYKVNGGLLLVVYACIRDLKVEMEVEAKWSPYGSGKL